jgi:ankyrin repeat protein
MFVKFINTILLCLCCAAAEISDANKKILFERAILNNDKNTVSLLLKAGFNLELPFDNGLTALNYAIQSNNDIEFISLLVKSGANVNLSGGRWPIIHAFSFNRKDVINLIIDNGYDDRTFEFNGVNSPLAKAAVHGDMELLKLLIPISTQVSKDCALCQAVISENSYVVEWLLNAGANVNGVMPNGNHCVFLQAIHSQNLKIVKILLQAGVEINCAITDKILPFYAYKMEMRKRYPYMGIEPSLLEFILRQLSVNTEQIITYDNYKKHGTLYQIAKDYNIQEVLQIFDEYYLNKLKQ